MYCYRLHFTAPFHVDGRGTGFYEESESFIRSDTLSAAIVSIWALMEPQKATLLAENPPFILSSAFPFFRETYFLPRPVASQAVRLSNEKLGVGKRLKKIRWLETSLWKQVAGGQSLDDPDSLHIWQDSLATPSAVGANFPDRLWAEEERPRLSIERHSNRSAEGQIFHFGRIYFHHQGGLYFFARFSDDASREDFEFALSLLADSGIGGDRNSGNGLFQWDHGPDLGMIDPGNGPSIAISLVNPSPIDCRENWLDGAAYSLVSRGGWIGGTGLRRSRIRMFGEGSMFRRPLEGRVVEVSPEPAGHPVFRDGRGFFVSVGESQ